MFVPFLLFRASSIARSPISPPKWPSVHKSFNSPSFFSPSITFSRAAEPAAASCGSCAATRKTSALTMINRYLNPDKMLFF